MRLAKYLAHAGVASRRAAEEVVRAGRVTIADEVVRDPARDVDDSSGVELDGRAVAGAQAHVVYAVHKPLGVVSTVSDPQRRPTVISLVDDARRLYPVGRLDIDSSGLILLTNDGALAHRLTHPSFEVPKTYRVTVANPPLSQRAVQALREGVSLDDGPTAPAHARRLGAAVLELTIREGRNRQVRRMLEAVGHPVSRLQRIRFGPLALGDLRPGAARALSASEVETLRGAAL